VINPSSPYFRVVRNLDPARLKSVSSFSGPLLPSRFRVYAVTMPCRDRSGTFKIKFWTIASLRPSPLYRVPAQGCRSPINSLILLAKFCESRIFTPGQGRHNPGTTSTGTRLHAGLDRVYGEGTSAISRHMCRVCPHNRPAAGYFKRLFGQFRVIL
jgi:hypothetical protein